MRYCRSYCSLIVALAGPLLSHTAFAQTNVSSFGAKGDGKTDDTAALQRAINSTPPGGTLTFGSAGNVYLISARLVFQPNRTYQGQSTILMSSGVPAHTAIAKLAYGAANSVTFSGLTFDANGVGGGIQIAVDGGASLPASNFNLQNTVIRNATASPAGPWDGAVYAPVGLINSTISNNRISNCGYGITVTDLNTVVIANNRFEGISLGDAVMVVFSPAAFVYGRGIQITGNTGQHLGRMGIELWPSGGNTAQTSRITGAIISGNTFSEWNNTATVDTFGISVMAGQQALVQNNRIIGPAFGYGIELGAPNSVVSQNTIQGFVTGVILHDSSGSVVSGNMLISQLTDGIEFSNAPGSRAGVTVSNNSIVNSQSYGILINTSTWGGASINGNFISRAAGSFEADATQPYIGIGITPPASPVTVASNLINQTAASAAAGFSFTGIRVNGDAGSNAGSTYQGNFIGSQSANVQSIGLFVNTTGGVNGAIVQANSFNGLSAASGGASSTGILSDANLIYNCLQTGPLFNP